MDLVKPDCYPCPCDICDMYKDALDADLRCLEYDLVVLKSVAKSTIGLSVVDALVKSSPTVYGPSVYQAKLSSPVVSNPIVSSPVYRSPVY